MPLVPFKVTFDPMFRLQKNHGWLLGWLESRRYVPPSNVAVPLPAASAAWIAFCMAAVSSRTPSPAAPKSFTLKVAWDVEGPGSAAEAIVP